ncbi:GNAT family N-acetyltransferase [Balneatrix alpica]|uniref:GNAT family N-acetyltransferase n=1 Tax=Balneatrix alpica TaxID=75684 RepID=UPI00273A4C13|nr:GNAT family N-acetyltransferase [Balneatrix alpica]
MIRAMQPQDAAAVSRLCLAAFQQAVAPTLSAEGVATFASIAAAEAFLARMAGDNLLWVAEQDGQVQGVIELKEGRHIAMLFVDPQMQRQGVGKALLATALQHARVTQVTVKASLSSVPAYQHYGFVCSDEVGESAGLIYQPMVIQRP